MEAKPFVHKPVLLREVLAFLDPQPGQVLVDCTLGGGGHGRELLEKVLPGGILVGLDQDREAVKAAREVLKPLGENNFIILNTNFVNLKEALRQIGIEKVDGILFDLGVSSYQLDEARRGFSYQLDAPLDMRMDPTSRLTAYDLVNTASVDELARVIKDYGEERWAKRIAQFIAEERKREPVKTTGKLVDIIKRAIPSGARREGPHPAKRTFQALRIAVNRELEILESSLEQGIELLKAGGRLAVITFHSLEDRIVKNVFQKNAGACTCPKNLPVCVCKRRPLVKIVTAKPVLPREDELADNPRSRSAKLRVVEKQHCSKGKES